MGYAALTIRKIAGPDAKGDGVRAAARLLRLPFSTVSRWKTVGYIPGFRHDLVRARASEAGIALGPEDFVDMSPVINGAAKAPSAPKSQQADMPNPKLAGVAA